VLTGLEMCAKLGFLWMVWMTGQARPQSHAQAQDRPRTAQAAYPQYPRHYYYEDYVGTTKSLSF